MSSADVNKMVLDCINRESFCRITHVLLLMWD